MTIRNLVGRGLPRLILAIAASALLGAGGVNQWHRSGFRL